MITPAVLSGVCARCQWTASSSRTEIDHAAANNSNAVRRWSTRCTRKLNLGVAVGWEDLARFGFGFSGLIAEMLFYRRALSAGERAAVDAYLKARYGL